MRISDWSSDVCSSDLHTDVSTADPSNSSDHTSRQPAGAGRSTVVGTGGRGRIAVRPGRSGARPTKLQPTSAVAATTRAMKGRARRTGSPGAGLRVGRGIAQDRKRAGGGKGG